MKRFLALRRRWTKHIVALLCLVAIGCAPQSHAQTFGVDKDEYVLMVAVDTSGSFSQQMAVDGKAYSFTLSVVDRYFRHRVGMPDRLIIASLSGTNRSLLWEGSPMQLRRDFPSPTKFRDFLLSKANPNGSRLHEGMQHALDYLLAEPAVESGQAKTAIFILSDMLDNTPNAEESEKKLVETLTTFAQKGGSLGLYYVDQFMIPTWRKHVRNAGFTEARVESEIVGKPPLPDFEVKRRRRPSAAEPTMPVAAVKPEPTKPAPQPVTKTADPQPVQAPAELQKPTAPTSQPTAVSAMPAPTTALAVTATPGPGAVASQPSPPRSPVKELDDQAELRQEVEDLRRERAELARERQTIERYRRARQDQPYVVSREDAEAIMGKAAVVFDDTDYKQLAAQRDAETKAKADEIGALKKQKQAAETELAAIKKTQEEELIALLNTIPADKRPPLDETVPFPQRLKIVKHTITLLTSQMEQPPKAKAEPLKTVPKVLDPREQFLKQARSLSGFDWVSEHVKFTGSDEPWSTAWTMLSLRPADSPLQGSAWLIQSSGGTYYACHGIFEIRESEDPSKLLVRLGFSTRFSRSADRWQHDSSYKNEQTGVELEVPCKSVEASKRTIVVRRAFPVTANGRAKPFADDVKATRHLQPIATYLFSSVPSVTADHAPPGFVSRTIVGNSGIERQSNDPPTSAR